VISAAKTSDLILMILDATKKAEQRALLEAELEAVGIRLNREPPYESPLLPVSSTPMGTKMMQQEYLPKAENCWRRESHVPSPAEEYRSENGL
jgi:hypothetical protein